MKLVPSRIASFLSKPDPEVRVILVFGPDEGLVRERAARLAQAILPDLRDPFRSITLEALAIKKDPALLADEMASLSLIGGRRLVRVSGADEDLAEAVLSLLAALPQTENILLIEAGELKKKSRLRGACEESPLACAIACYVEEGSALERTVSDFLAREDIRAARDVVAALAGSLPPDTLAMRNELEKFALYVGKGAVATRADVHAAIEDAGAAELDALVFAVGAGEPGRAMQLIDRLYAEQMSAVAVLRAAQRHFLRIHWARAEMDKGVGAPEAVKRLKPPVFWKYESAMSAQLRRWSCARAEQALRRLYDAEAAVKRTGTPDLSYCAQVLLGLASLKGG